VGNGVRSRAVPARVEAAAVTRILAIDPGYEQSAVVRLDAGRVTFSETSPNESVLRALHDRVFAEADVFVIEQVASYGMPVGREVFETVHWAGRFFDAIHWSDIATNGIGSFLARLPRKTVVTQICGSSRAKDANVRQALIDRYGGSKAEAVGTKAKPGPLYGVHGDQWAALALAVAWAEGAR
jgi:hypothetical protein